MNILIINGPNLNFLGERRTELYGKLTLAAINRKIRAFSAAKNARVRFFQSNCEGRLIDAIYGHRKWADWIIINPGAYAHYSYALRDAIEACGLPAVETHITDIGKREPFRRKSVTAPACRTMIKGLGWKSYIEAVKYCLKNTRKT